MALLLGACGTKFVADDGAAGGAGEAAGAGKASAGESPQGGAPSAGASSGGSGGRAGEPGAGGSSGSAGAGGLAGSAGFGGGPTPTPEIPRVGLALWLRADEGVVQENGAVARWLDQSGNKLDALQSPGDSRPSFDPAGFNARPTVLFDGKFDYLEFESGFATFKNGMSAFIVTRPAEAPESCWSMFELSNGSEVDDISIGAWQRQWLYEVSASYQQKGEVVSGLPALVTTLHRVGGTVDVRVNGALQGSSTFALPIDIERSSNFVGRTLYQDCQLFRGAISEIILYSRAVTAGELRAIEAYLTEHWALGTPVPAP